MKNNDLILNIQNAQVFYLNGLEKGEYLYFQGNQSNEFYYIQSGMVGLYHVTENGKESLMRVYKENDFFGYRTLFSDSKIYHCSAKVMIDCNIIKITPTQAQSFLQTNQELAKVLMYSLSRELQEAENRLSQVAFSKTLDRVFHSIRYLCENYPNYKWTYREIAEYAGCETETAIRISKELKKTGMLESNKKH